MLNKVEELTIQIMSRIRKKKAILFFTLKTVLASDDMNKKNCKLVSVKVGLEPPAVDSCDRQGGGGGGGGGRREKRVRCSTRPTVLIQ